MGNELRRDYFLERWVIIASNRAKRPSDFIKPVVESKDEGCFFCRGNEHTTPPEIWRIPEKTEKWRIRCFPNKFPAVTAESGESIYGFKRMLPAQGYHEVIVETPHHHQPPAAGAALR